MLIAIKNITKQYVTDEIVTPVLRGVTLDIQQGDFVAIMGPSGSGKSTLMHILGFLDRPTEGEYFFNGRDTNGLSDDELATLRNTYIGFVFQQFFLLPKTSVFDNVQLPQWYAGAALDAQRVYAAIDAVGLSHRRDHLSNQLSGGEKQRVAIARALVNEPQVIFADEPTGNLDSKSGQQVMSILQDLNEQGKTILLVTHESYTAQHAKRIVRIRDGMIESDQRVEARQIAKNGGELIK